jgi:hypothetical protein
MLWPYAMVKVNPKTFQGSIDSGIFHPEEDGDVNRLGADNQPPRAGHILTIGFIRDPHLLSGDELEDGTAAGVTKVEVTAVASGAIEVALCVDDQFAVGVGTVRTSGEIPNHGLLTGFVHLEHGSNTIGATAVGGAIEVTGLVQDQFSVGKFAVRLTGKAIQRFEHTADTVYLVHLAPVVIAANRSDAVKFVEMVPDHAWKVNSRAAPAGEAVHDGNFVIGKLEDRALEVDN